MSPLRVVVAALVVAMPARAADVKALPDDKVRVGFVNSLFKDSTTPFSQSVLDAFGAMVRGQTGLNTQVLRGGETHELAGKLRDAQVHFGIFQGIEFAWVREKNPELKPLVLAVCQHARRHACLVVRADSKAAGFADLRGKSLVLPLHSRAHCELFLEKGCREAGSKDPKRFFASFARADYAEDALDDLVDGDIHGVVVDGVALERYQKGKPGRFEKLKVLKKSEAFPSTVVAYRPGSLDEKRLQLFRDGLIRAHQSILGRSLMTLWKLTSFEPVPKEYENDLANILKAYPPPK